MRPLLLAVLLPLVLSREPAGVQVARSDVGALSPRISPDGEWIAFSLQGAIWRVGVGGGAFRRLTSGPGFDDQPAWSPDGRRLAYLQGSALRMIDVDGAPQPAPPNVAAQGKLVFHPDGKRLLGNFRDARGAALSWLDLATGALTPVLAPPREARVFALSPDGGTVVHATSQDVPGEQGGHNGPQMDLWTTSGGETRKLLRFRSRVFDLAWGKEIYLTSDLGGAHDDLWSLDPAAPTHVHRITNGGADEDAPSVSADGRRLAHTDNRAGATALVVRDFDSGESRELRMAAPSYGRPTGTLRLRVAEEGTGRPLCARLSVQQKGGKFHAPFGALYRIAGAVEHFYADGEADLFVPAGTYVVQGFRGLEWLPFRAEVEVPENGRAELAVALRRWTDPASKGWRSGESHIHANYGYGHWYNTPETMRLQIEGEGLEVANFVVANSDGDGVFDREFFRGEPDPVSSSAHILQWNQEYRATLWGHLTFYNLTRLVEPVFTGFKDTTNPFDTPTNADAADHVHLQGGHVNYTHPANNLADPYGTAYSAKSLPVDVALGRIDSLDVNWGWEATLQLWYRLLNCGFRLPASAGTDCFLNRIRSRLPGSDRAYVKLEGPLSHAAWVQGLKAGRSFVTNGPMLDFEAGGRGLGGTIRLEGPGKVAVRASARSAAPLSKLELVHDGRVVLEGVRSDDRSSADLAGEVQVARSGWLAARASAGPSQQAHTSPIYVEVAGTAPSSREDAEYFLKWIDRLEAQLRARDRVPTPALRAHVEAQLNAAREVYRSRTR